MAAVDGPTHIVRDVNDAFCRLVCKGKHVLLGRPFAEIDPQWATEKECIALLDRVYQTRQPETMVDEPQFSFASVEPAYWTYSAWVDPTSASDRQPVGVIVQITDTTEAHKFRHMAALMNQELIVSSVRLSEQTETMAQGAKAKDDFLATLGHEIRNPLSAINNAAKLIEMQSNGQDKLLKPVTIMIRQVRQLARLVDDLMDVSRITHGKLELRKERVDLSAIARRAAEVAQNQMDVAGCAFSFSAPTEPIWLDGDSARLEQILGNLLNNAAKYTDAGGSVSFAVKREKDEAVIQVTDTGTGISPEMLSSIFDAFVQEDRSLSRSKGGLGIGLTLVKTLAELHGGTVGVQSAGQGQGSVFTVRLPAEPEDAMTKARAAGRADSSARALNVLLVEDNVFVALPLARILELWGHRVRVVHDGASAIEEARQDAPDTVLLDLGLPEMDGYEVARVLRSTEGLERVRLVALTGYGTDADHNLVRNAGFDDHLVKPVDFARLQSTLAAREADTTEDKGSYKAS